MAEPIELEIVLEDGSIKKAFANIKNEGEKAGRAVGNGLQSNIDKSLSGLKTKLISFAASFAAAFAFNKTIKAAIQQENAVNKINSALASTGKYTQQASLDFQKYASQLQATSKFGDEVILENAALIQSLGNLSVNGLKKATTAAADFATALGVDLRTASLLVGKAAAGNIESFSRYGLSITKGKTAAESFANTLAAIEGRFGGSSLRALSTFDGATTQLSNSFGDMLEEIGFIITKSPIVVFVINEMTRGVQSLSSKITDFAKTGAFNEVLRKIFSFASSFNTYFVAPIELAINAVKLAFKAIPFFIQLALRAAVDSVISFVENIPEVGKAILEKVAPGLLTLGETLKETLVPLQDETFKAYDNLFNFSLSTAIDNGINSLNAKLPQFSETITQFKNAGVNGTSEMANGVQKNVDQIEKALSQQLASALSTAIQRLSTRLAQGKSIFSDFGKFVLTTLGDMAIQIGTLMIALGITIQAFLVSALTSPLALVAYGAGLVALGSIIKAKAGSGGGEFDSGFGGVGGVAGTSTPGQESIVGQQEIQQEPSATVAINVQGSVFNTSETADSIVSLVNEAFEQRGVRILQA